MTVKRGGGAALARDAALLVGRAEALISRKELATQALDAATGCAQGLGELAQLLTPLAQLEPSTDEPEPTWLLENGELPENMALTAANFEEIDADKIEAVGGATGKPVPEALLAQIELDADGEPVAEVDLVGVPSPQVD